MMNKVKFQHYVPRFYLANFADGEGMLWGFDKTNYKRIRQRPENIGGQNFFYDVPELDAHAENGQVLERHFGNYEGTASTIIRNWLSAAAAGSITLSKEDKKTFSLFLALQHLRTPEHRKSMIQWIAAFQGSFGRTSEKFPKEKEKYITANSLLSDEMTATIAAALNNHIWIFHRNTTANPFYTSDHPILLESSFPNTWHGGLGITSTGIKIYYPLSSTVSLSILERKHWKKNVFVRSFEGKLSPLGYSPETVKHDNSGHVAFSTRWLYCRDDDFSFAQEMCDKHPESRDPDRQRITNT